MSDNEIYIPVCTFPNAHGSTNQVLVKYSQMKWYFWVVCVSYEWFIYLRLYKVADNFQQYLVK